MKNIVVNPGDRRHQVQIQQQSTTQDTLGGQIETWATIRETWASIRTAGVRGPRETSQEGQFSGQVTHVINIRYMATPAIIGGMRVVFGSHIYMIQTPDNVDLRSISVDLMCLEIDGSQ